MKYAGALILLLAATLFACRDAPPSPRTAGHDTSVLGGYGSRPGAAAPGAPTGANGEAIPPPKTPLGVKAQMARADDGAVLALWVQDSHVVAATHSPATGWSAPQPLETIYGQASDPQLASNGRGAAMAVWRHTVGSIQSLRYSRFDHTGWSVPDVMPGALPRPRGEAGAAPRLHMDAEGRAFAEWPSGFHPQELQSARFVPGQGWGRAESEPLAAADAPARSAAAGAPRSVQ